MLVRCNLKKGSAEANDFESNHKADAIRIEKIVFAGTAFIRSESYDAFQKRVDGEVVKWSDVMYREDAHNYELWLKVGDE